ncbi:SRPBCC family protein [Winogradskyella maritima]|uniref:SRPBCC family protein n=1 Tax=Winogradskyella maritima TaxID=1517766 RepID=A0ABV8AFC8_9FLAO|nr:SRPBCC family protein [Winogradskyella maritima]
MKKRIETVNQVNAPLAKVWAKVEPGTHMDKWMPIIETCSVEGNKRICTTPEGATLHETIQTDAENKVFKYSIDKQDFMPISDIEGTITLKDNGDNTTMHWDVDFEISKENEPAFPEIKKNIEGIYQMASISLAEFANA